MSESFSVVQLSDLHFSTAPDGYPMRDTTASKARHNPPMAESRRDGGIQTLAGAIDPVGNSGTGRPLRASATMASGTRFMSHTSPRRSIVHRI